MSTLPEPRASFAAQRAWVDEVQTTLAGVGELRALVRDQLRWVVIGLPPYCGRCLFHASDEKGWPYVYRCLDCGVWFCPGCARAHFGAARAQAGSA